MSKALALAFVVVLLFVAVAGVLIYLNVFTNPAQRILPPPPPPATSTSPTEASSTAEPIVFATPTPALWSSPTPTDASARPTPAPATPTAVSTTPAAPTATRTVAFATTTITPTAPATLPLLTATPAGAFDYALDGAVIHDLQTSCLAQYLRGTVRDAQGKPLEGVRVQASDLWGNVATTTSKGGPDAGYWDIVLSSTPNVWRLVILDAAGAPISPPVDVPHHQEGEFKNACTHLANWKRAW
jgi:hypothetical protein